MGAACSADPSIAKHHSAVVTPRTLSHTTPTITAKSVLGTTTKNGSKDSKKAIVVDIG